MANITTGKHRRGGAYLVALALSLVLTVIVMATQLETVQELKVTKTEHDYERALAMAEAGVNAYINRMTFGPVTPATPGDPNDPAYLVPNLYDFNGAPPTAQEFRTATKAGSYTLVRYPAGSQVGYFAGTVTNGAEQSVAAYGWSNGVVRRVIVPLTTSELSEADPPATTIGPAGDYAVYGISSLTIKNNAVFSGKVGSNGPVTMGNNNVIQNGSLVLNGTGIPLTQGSGNQMTVMRTGTASAWKPVTELALDLFPNSGSTAPGGLAYLATHNDNGLSGLSGTSLSRGNGATVRLLGKSTGAHYYFTNMQFGNNCTLVIDNALGPVNVWLGPNGGSGRLAPGLNFTVTQTSTAPDKRSLILSATTAALTVLNNFGTAVGIYAYSVYNGNPIGSIDVQNTGTFGGSLVANTITMQNNAGVAYTSGTGPFFQPGGAGGYYLPWGWSE